MPTYSYRCTECGTAFDIQQAFTDDSLTECPTCDEEGAPPPVPLLRPVIVGGMQVGALPDAHAARELARENLARLPKVIRSLYDEEHSYRVEYSAELWGLYEDLLEQFEGQPS